MNIKITYNWLLEWLETDANPDDIQRYLSLSGPSVESVQKVGNDYLFDIEITSNRVDAASVVGIARECKAILPRYGILAKLRKDPLTLKFKDLSITSNNKKLNIQIKDKNLCPRFTAVIISNVKVGPSNSKLVKRLESVGLNSINNLVDISNYLMLELGAPSHIFDYDKIVGGKMILRSSRPGEKITTLDSKTYTLPGGDIVIEDGSGELIDLCGIMGGENSAVTSNTKNIVLFVQTYNKERIRKTSMNLGFRTQAAIYFEKGIDPEGVESTFARALELILKNAGGRVDSQLYDIYPNRVSKKKFSFKIDDIKKLIGVDIKDSQILNILSDIDFKPKLKKDEIDVEIPLYRSSDVSSRYDITEEVARIYGYHNLPSHVQKTDLVVSPEDYETSYKIKNKVTNLLASLGLTEVYNYSMISRQLLEFFNLNVKDYLRLSNSISHELEYLRSSLVPSLVKNIKDNQGKADIMYFFEIARIYKKCNSLLPKEEEVLSIATTESFDDLKGIIEAVFEKLNINSWDIVKSNKGDFLDREIQVEILDKSGKYCGYLAKLSGNVGQKMGILTHVYISEIDLASMARDAKDYPTYKKESKFAKIILDYTYKSSPKLPFTLVKKNAFKLSKSLLEVMVVDRFEDKITLRLVFGLQTRNMTESEAIHELSKLKKSLNI